MRFIERHGVVRASFVLLLIPLLAAIDGCGTEVPIGSDTGGGSRARAARAAQAQ